MQNGGLAQRLNFWRLYEYVAAMNLSYCARPLLARVSYLQCVLLV